jgi:3-dehydroquinate synthase
MSMLQKSLTIRSSASTYEVDFPEVDSLVNWLTEADLLIVDDFFAGNLHPSLQERSLLIKADEEAKAFDRMGELLIELKARGLTRSSILLGLGGGVIQDITTFLASVYMRGIPWIYVPTTLLAMVDSCLGGKSSINVGPVKNLVGTFHPPHQITVITALARSLPLVELRAGLAEAAKICFCRGVGSFERYCLLAEPLLSGAWSDNQLAELIHHVLSVKQWFIETDEFDRAERRLLNFGHTWGHALESASGYSIPHGLAVALGMEASHRYIDSPDDSKELIIHIQALLKDVISGSSFSQFDLQQFLASFRADKKHGRDHYHVIVPSPSNSQIPLGVEERRLPRDRIQEAAVLQAMLEVIEELPS